MAKYKTAKEAAQAEIDEQKKAAEVRAKKYSEEKQVAETEEVAETAEETESTEEAETVEKV